MCKLSKIIVSLHPRIQLTFFQDVELQITVPANPYQLVCLSSDIVDGSSSLEASSGSLGVYFTNSNSTTVLNKA